MSSHSKGKSVSQGSAVPSDNTVTVDGYVVPSLFAKAIHAVGLALGAFVAIAPTYIHGLPLTNLGQLAHYLAGGVISTGTILSYMSHEKSNDKANAVTYQANLSTAIPEVENVVANKVLPFIDTEFPGFKSDLIKYQQDVTKVVTDVRAKAEADKAEVIAAVSEQIAKLPPPVQNDVSQVKAEVIDWLKARFDGPATPPAPIPTQGPVVAAPATAAAPTTLTITAPAEAVKIIGGDA